MGCLRCRHGRSSWDGRAGPLFADGCRIEPKALLAWSPDAIQRHSNPARSHSGQEPHVWLALPFAASADWTGDYVVALVCSCSLCLACGAFSFLVRPHRPFTTHRMNLAATTYPFLLHVRCVTTKGGARDSDFEKAVSRRDPGQDRLARLHSTCKIADLARSKKDAAGGRAAMLLPHRAAGAAGAVVRRSRREARTVPVSMPAGGENRPALFPR